MKKTVGVTFPCLKASHKNWQHSVDVCNETVGVSLKFIMLSDIYHF